MSAQADCIDSAVQNAGVSSQAILAGVNVMILGMPFSAFTWLHVVLSLIGIASGIIVLFGMLGGKSVKGPTALFLATTVLTSVTGFMFPFAGARAVAYRRAHIPRRARRGHPCHLCLPCCRGL
jgi:hypothetical protein